MAQNFNMVTPQRVTSTLTFLSVAIALSYAAFSMNCVYGHGTCNQNPMVLWDANEACCPGQPTCPVPNGAPGDQSSNISDRALDLNVSVRLTSTRATPCQGFDDTVSIKVLPELTKALSLLLGVDVEPLLTPDILGTEHLRRRPSRLDHGQPAGHHDMLSTRWA